MCTWCMIWCVWTARKQRGTTNISWCCPAGSTVCSTGISQRLGCATCEIPCPMPSFECALSRCFGGWTRSFRFFVFSEVPYFLIMTFNDYDYPLSSPLVIPQTNPLKGSSGVHCSVLEHQILLSRAMIGCWRTHLLAGSRKWFLPTLRVRATNPFGDRCWGTAFTVRAFPLVRWVYLYLPTPCWST